MASSRENKNAVLILGMPKRKKILYGKQHGGGFFGDAWAFVKDKHLLSGIGSAATPFLAAWNPIAGTAAAAATAALKQNGWGPSARFAKSGEYYQTRKVNTPSVSASYGNVKFK
jgi:hypothetical protein